jgi:hypothetical protein
VFAALRLLTRVATREQLSTALVFPLVLGLGLLYRVEAEDGGEHAAGGSSELASGPSIEARVDHVDSSFGFVGVDRVAHSLPESTASPSP